MTGHVMWTKPLDSGGVVGGNQTAIAGDTYFEGSAYNQRYTNPIIVDGMLYYTEPISFAGVPGGLSGSAYGPMTASTCKLDNFFGAAPMYQRCHSLIFMTSKTPTNTESTNQYYSQHLEELHSSEFSRSPGWLLTHLQAIRCST